MCSDNNDTKQIVDLHHKWDHRRADWRSLPVCYDVFARSAQSAETRWNTAHRPKRRFVVYEHDRSAVLFFTLCGWKQEEIFLHFISIFCVYGQTGFFHSLPEQMFATDKIFTTGSSTALVHMGRYNQHQMKVPLRGFKS